MSFGLDEQFKKIQESAKDALNSVFPIEGKTRVLKLEGVMVEDSLRDDDYQGQTKVKAKNGTWGVPVYAKLALYDKATGKLMDRADKIRLFMLPKATNRYSYIVGGNEYQVSNQLRLKSGAYAMRKQNGELKTAVNLSAGKNFDLRFDEKSAQFTIDKVGGGQARIPLYPVLTHLGMSHADIERSWGSQIAAANKQTDEKVLTRTRAAFGIKRGDIGEYFDQTKIDPDTTKMTLGKSFDKVSAPMLLAASKKLLEVHLGNKPADDRDALEYKEIHGVEDFISERLKKNKDSLAFRIKRTIDSPKREKISQLVNPGSFNNVVEGFFTQDDKSATPEQTNPLEMLSGQYKATIMGSGGIKSDHAVTNDMREVHPSHYGFIDAVHTPESSRIGANLHLPLGFTKSGVEINKVVIGQDGKPVKISPAQAYDKKIAFPGQTGPKYKVNYRGKTVEVSKPEVDYFTPNAEALFSWSTNLIPFLPSNQGNRSMMAAKMLEQAISLKHREAPLVQVKMPNGQTAENFIGKDVAVTSAVDGVVKSITDDEITIKGPAGETKYGLYNHFSLNRKSYMHNFPVVKKGDTVKKGQLLADSNFTKNGTLALGTNLKVAYIPFKGLNFEDGIVISESAADKLTSEHIHKKTLDIDPTTILKLGAFRTQYPSAATPENLAKLDDHGVIKKGMKVKQGDILIASLQKRVMPKTVTLIERKLADRPKDTSVSWNYEDDGVVTDIIHTSKGIEVQVKTSERAKIGDKLAGRFGNKGVITAIIPDGELPKNADGEHPEVLLNPHGVISRINIGQIYESAAGKVAKKTGKPYEVKNFSGENYLDTTKKFLKDNHTDDKEELFDAGGKSLGKVHVGNPYILKLFKQSQGNFSVRQGGPGNSYDSNLQPIKAGGDDSAKNLDVLTMYSMLAHGARANLREMSSLKSNQNDEYWKALKSGQTLPPPKASFVFDKFVNYLKAAGIDVKKDGSKMTLAPMTDSEVLKASNGDIKKPMFFRAKDMEPIKGGFLDPVKTGGYKGTKWNHIELTEPIVNPVFETAVRKITDLGTKYDSIMDGKLHITKGGEFNTDGKGLTGGAAIEHILKGINIDDQIQMLKAKALKSKGNALDDVNKKLRYFMTLKKFDMKPEEAYIRRNIAVIPPVYRPVYTLPDGSVTTSDVNLIYQNIGVLNTMAKLPVMGMLPEDEKAILRKDIYEHAKGISGLSDINIKGKDRKGFISEIAGDQPKTGFFISKVISKKQDFIGRSTIIPDPDLGIDQVGLPEEMAWKLFEPFIVRELVTKFGKTPIAAMEEVKNKTPLAKKAREVVMKDRHVMINRAPSLHKFSIMAMKPQITSGTAIKIPPLVVKGFNADFDGDTMVVHTPIGDEANREAEKMLPSRNLYKPGSGSLMIVPSQEAQIGLFYLSQTPAGRTKLNALMGNKFHVNGILDKKTTTDLMMKISKESTPEEFGRLAAVLKSEGEKHSYDIGVTLGLNDLKDMKEDRDKVVNAVAKQLKTTSKDGLSALSNEANKLIDAVISKKLKGTHNPLFDMIESGAKGSPSQLRAIVASPLFVNGADGRIVPSVIKKSYSEGLDIGDYWTSMYGARKGMMDRAKGTSAPGAFSKDIMASTIDNVISAEDCGTKKGVMLSVNSKDILGRFLAGDQGGVAHNTLVDSNTVKKLKGLTLVKVRSPLTCLQPKGTCSKCHGHDESGQSPSIGTNIGAIAGQAMSEPLIQLVMNSFHTGGAAGTGSDVVGYKRIDQLMKLPKVVANAATLAPKTGVIKSIKKGLAGGYDLLIDDHKAHVSHGRKLKVELGDHINIGDPLSDGVIKPQELVKLKGMQPAQEYMVDELKKAYGDQGVHIDRRIFETVIRSLGNSTQILNNPKGSNFVAGDIAPYTVVNHHNEHLEEAVPVEEAEGCETAQAYGPIKAGTVLGHKEIEALKRTGYNTVEVIKDAIKHAPLLKSVTTLPIMKKNWMAAMGYRNLAKALTEGAGHGHETDLEDYHPIPAFAYGANFGKGKNGKY